MGFLKRFAAKRSMIKGVDDSQELMDDFKLRTPFGEYRPISYRRYIPFDNYMEVDNEKRLQRLEEGGGIDDGTGDALDNLIEDGEERSNVFAQKQKISFDDTIEMFRIRRAGDLKYLIQEIARLEQEEACLCKELDEAKERYQRYKFREDSERRSEDEE